MVNITDALTLYIKDIFLHEDDILSTQMVDVLDFVHTEHGVLLVPR